MPKRKVTKEDKEWAIKVKSRDNWKCVICGDTIRLNAHHIIPREVKHLRYSINNGISLCPKHHKFSNEISAHKNPFEFIKWLLMHRAPQILDLELIKYKKGVRENMVIVEDIAVSGEFVEKLKDKHCVILNKPVYEELPDLSNPDNKLRKLMLRIEFKDGIALDYYPNKTSIKVLTKLYGFETNNWLGKEFQFMVNTQQAFGKEQKVLFVCDKKVKE